jgi:hypothetical protein
MHDVGLKTILVQDDAPVLITVDELKAQITPNLQKLMNDILLEANDPRPLMFGDEQEFETIKGKPFPAEINACFNPFMDRLIIFLKRVDKIRCKEQHDIAHELGHLWLLFLGLPSEKKTTDRNRQESWDTFFSPLREIMEHAVYYRLIKDKYQIDLYKIGNERLTDFIIDQLPQLGNKSTTEKLLLILNYLKYKVESDDHYWLGKMHKIYSDRALDVINVGDSLLPLVQKLAGTKDTQLFISQYRQVLEILDTHFTVPVELWPTFVIG